MKNYELFEIGQHIGNVLPSLEKIKGAKFHYALLKNIDLLQKELNLIQTKAKPSDSFTEYEKARVALCEKHAGKNDKGEPNKRDIGNGQTEYAIDTESEAWKNDIDKLKAEHQTAITERDEQIKQYNDMLDLDADIKFHLLSLEDIPNEVDGEQMRALKHWIKQD